MAFKATLRSLMGSLVQRSWNVAPPALILPEFQNTQKISIPTIPFGASMELMAVPKKKVSPHKKGIRNGPKALKPIPVIIRCKLYEKWPSYDDTVHESIIYTLRQVCVKSVQTLDGHLLLKQIFIESQNYGRLTEVSTMPTPHSSPAPYHSA